MMRRWQARACVPVLLSMVLWRVSVALNKKRDPRLLALILQAAAEVKRINPHIGAVQTPVADSEYTEYTEMVRGREEMERVWDDVERQRGGPVTDEIAARAVDQDRGE
jgi:hypothetical protein